MKYEGPSPPKATGINNNNATLHILLYKVPTDMCLLHMNKQKKLFPGFQVTEQGLTLEVLPRKTVWETLLLEISSLLRICKLVFFK